MLNNLRLLLCSSAALLLVACGEKSSHAVLVHRVVMMDVVSDQSTFTREKDGWFYTTEERSEISMVMADATPGEGKFPDIEFAGSTTEVSTDLPDRAAGELNKIRIIRDDKKTYIETKVSTLADLGGDLMEFESKAEIEFVKGDWFEYEAGAPVEFRLTKAGLKSAKESLADQLEEALTPMLRIILLEDLKEEKKKEGWEISDADLGRLAYVETDISFPAFANTVYKFEGSQISYSETDNTQIYAIIGIGVTSENFK